MEALERNGAGVSPVRAVTSGVNLPGRGVWLERLVAGEPATLSVVLHRHQEGVLLAALMPFIEAEGRRSGAFRRVRGISDMEHLLQILLMHVGMGYSLKETSARARLMGLGNEWSGQQVLEWYRACAGRSSWCSSG